MNRKINVLVVTLMFCLTAIVVIPDNIVKATEPEINFDYIKIIAENLSDVIFRAPYNDTELKKGRAFGSKGEWFAAIYLANEMEDNLSLYDPTSNLTPSYRERIENIQSEYNNIFFDDINLTDKLEVLEMGIMINGTNKIEGNIRPRWNFTILSSPKFFNIIKIPLPNGPLNQWYHVYDLSKLTYNFSYNGLKIRHCYPICTWFSNFIDNINCSLFENFTDGFPYFLEDFLFPLFEDYYNFNFSDLNETNIADILPFTNNTDYFPACLGQPFVFIRENPEFNPNNIYPTFGSAFDWLEARGLRRTLEKLEMMIWRVKYKGNCKGVILFDHNNETYDMNLRDYYALPTIYINGTIGKNINQSVSDYTLDFWVNQNWNTSTVSYNVIGQINGTNPGDENNTLILGGLYDGWWNQGAADGAVGMGIVLALAKYMKELEANYSKPVPNIKFIGFGGEEYLGRGAYYYEAKHPNSEENVETFIDLNQLGFRQADPENDPPLDLYVNSNKLFTHYLIKNITDKTNYEDRTEYTGFKTKFKRKWESAFGNYWAYTERLQIFNDRRLTNTIYIVKDTNWTRHHRSGEDHTEGDVMDYYDSKDANVSAELIWNITKFFAYRPNCWFQEDPTFDLYDTNSDGYNDTINVSYIMKTSWQPSEPVSVRLVIYPKYRRLHPTWKFLYRIREQKEYILTTGTTNGYINVTLPNCFPKGEYNMAIYLCNSRDDIILDTIHLFGAEVAIDGLELVDHIKDVLKINILEALFPFKVEIYKKYGWEIGSFIKGIKDLRDQRVRDILIDFLGYYKFRNDSYSDDFELYPPNTKPDKPDKPSGETEVKALQLYKYKTKTTDSDTGDKIRYQWDWGIGIPGCWSVRQYNPGVYHYKDHAWLFAGNKEIRVRAKNPRSPNVFSDWSETLSVTASSTGCTFDIYTTQTNQININNPNSLNSFDNKAVVRGHDTDYVGDYYGFLEVPTFDYNFSGLQMQSGPVDTNYTFTDSAGIKYINLTADDNGTVAYYNTTINVVNISPCFNMNQFGAQPDKTINFTDTTISNKTIVNWTWNLGDGTISYEQNVSHNYTTIGAYNVTLTVKDVNSEEATFWQIVPIETDPPEIIDATYYPIPGTLGCNMTICAELFDDNGSGINTVTVNISYPNGTANNYTMIEDENNSYGYKYVFNDTMQVGWYFFDIWVTDSANNSNNFPGCGFEIQPAFGYSTIGNQSKNIDDNISGSNFTVLANGTAESISAYIHANLSTPPETKCMIYRVNDSTLIGTTEVKAINTGDEPDWVTYNFTTSKPNLTTNTQYILTCWSNDTCNLSYHNASDDSYGKYLSYSYGTPPNSIVNGTNESRIYSIFCNYSTIPFIRESSASPDPFGFGYNTTITAEVEHYYTLVENITVNITYPNSTYVNYSMDQVDDDTFQYTTDDLWTVGQYNYTIWVKDKLGGNSTNAGYSFNVSVQATITVSTIKDSYGDNKTVNLTDPPDDPPLVCYELLDNGNVLHLWNKYDNYYFDTDSGIQLTNHYNDYWSHNVLMLGYYNNDEWNLIYRTDELSGFNKDLDTDNETYINVTMWKNLEYQSYDFRLAIRYCLGVDDNELTVIPYIKNLGEDDIPYTLGFGWEMKDIQIDMTTTGDYIDVNGTMYCLNQTLDNTYTDLLEPEFYLMENISEAHTKSLYLKWNQSLTYKLQVKSRDSQYNAPITLFVRIGTLASGQEKYTKMYWYDADQVTYYFDGYDNSEVWTISPWYMVDGITSNYALTTSDSDIELCDDNNCSGSDIGEITTVEIRAHAYYAGDSRIVLLRPVFGGTTDGLNYPYSPTPSPGACSSWLEITRDPFAPGTWTWTDVVNLDCDVEVENDPYGDPFTMYCSKVDIRVTYNPYNPPGISNPYPANGGMGVPLTPMLNITVSDSDNDLMNITWLSNSSGSWQVFGTNNSVNNGVYHQMFTNATENGKWWYWKVNVTDGYNYTVSSVYKFYTGYQSKINNTGSCHFKGYLLMQVHYYNETSEEWEVANDTVNETTPRVIPWADPGGTPGQNILALDSIFNGLVNTSDLSSYGNGTYRIYVAFRDPDGNVLVCNDEAELNATYEFTIIFD